MGDEQSGYVASDVGVSAEPVYVAGWRGRCRVPSQEMDINLAAHFPKEASSILLNLTRPMPVSLCLEKFPRSDVWPAYFNFLPPTEFSIDLLFSSEGSEDKVLDKLLQDAICSDFALKADLGLNELLIFTSLQLPEKIHKFKGRDYFWGLFMPKSKNDALHTVGNELNTSLSSSSYDDGSFERETSLENTFVKSRPLTQTSQARKKPRGDAAWKHAKRLNGVRDGAMCKYCDFITNKRGGISQVKAHLAGGSLKVGLPGCPNVSPKVKQAMAIWFHDWSKTSKAEWLTRKRASRAKTLKRTRSTGYVVSKEEITSQLNAQPGEDHPMPLKGCSNIKNLVSEVCVEKEFPDEKLQEFEGTTGSHHITQKSRNTALEKTLVELIDEKKANLQKEQSNLRKLEKHLALIS